MIVLDASAAIEWMLQTAVGSRVEERIFSQVETLHRVPGLGIKPGMLREIRGNALMRDLVVRLDLAGAAGKRCQQSDHDQPTDARRHSMLSETAYVSVVK